MNTEFLNEAINLFNMPEKWNSFIELSNKRNEVINLWNKKAKNVINNFFLNDTVESWSFISWGIWDYRWYLEDFGKESLCIWIYGNRIQLWLNGNDFDSNVVTSLLNTDRYSSLLSLFRPDGVFEGDFKIIEMGDFVFNSVNDGHISSEELAWYAGNRTEEFVTQIAEKVNRIRKNPELTQLLHELNEKCKR